MSTRNLEFATKVDQKEVGDKITSLFFTSNSQIFEHRFHSPFLYTETVNTLIFDAPFFQNASSIFVCFPSIVGVKDVLEVHISNDQSALRSYLLLDDTIDYETDIYLFSSDLKWCIRYIDEFYPNNSRMTFLHSNEELI